MIIRIFEHVTAAMVALLSATSLGIGATFAASPDATLMQGRLDLLQADIVSMPHGVVRDYFTGVMNSRRDMPQDAVGDLRNALPALRTTRGSRLAEALYDLTYDNVLLGRYDRAARYGEELSAPDLLETLDRHRRQDAIDDLPIWRLLAATPPMSVAYNGPVRTALHRTMAGLFAIPVTAGGYTVDWSVDSGANLTVVTASLAHRINVMPYVGELHDKAGLTGLDNVVHVGVIPKLVIGHATITWVPVLIFDDAALTFNTPRGPFVINALLGYPVLRELGSVRFSTHNGFVAHEVPAPTTAADAPLGVYGLTPTIGVRYHGRMLTGSVDTGADSTDMGIRFRGLLNAQDKGGKRTSLTHEGAGGKVVVEGFVMPQVGLQVGDHSIRLLDVFVPASARGSITDQLYANFGQDLWARTDGPVFDFTNRRFAVR